MARLHASPSEGEACGPGHRDIVGSEVRKKYGKAGHEVSPERHMESITALMETAGATVEGIRQQTRAGLEFALEEHKTINAKLDLQAPLIIVPQSISTKKSTCLILDAGHISVNSELVDKTTMKEVQSKQSQVYTDEDYKKLESLMYDRFIVKLTSTQVLIGPSIKDTKAYAPGELRTQSPQSEGRIQQVLQWQSPGAGTLENEQQLLQLSIDAPPQTSRASATEMEGEVQP